MANTKKLIQAAAGAAGGEALNVEDVFSTYLYTGTGSTQTITNDIDLSGEGGLVWIKSRSWTYPHNLYDTERGATKRLKSSSTSAESTLSTGLTAFSSTGFTLGGDNDTNGTYSSAEYASWTFRKAPKFFDVVTYTGNGTAGKTVSHSLGSVPGMIIVKRTDDGGAWYVYHRSIGNTKFLGLNNTDQAVDPLVGVWNDTDPTSTQFTLGTNTGVNANGGTYVAYLFAHNDGDGEFGPNGDQDIIKCGSYTGTGVNGNSIDLGFEPQFLIMKNATLSRNWLMYDSMRGLVNNGNDVELFPNTTGADANSGYTLDPLANGFSVGGNDLEINGNGYDYIYIAIRRGPMAVPESATDVFEIDRWNSTGDGNNPNFRSDFPVDMILRVDNTAALDNRKVSSRLTGNKFMFTNGTNTEGTDGDLKWDFMNGVWDSPYYNSLTSRLGWMWRRAPNFFDVVAYTGNYSSGVSPQTLDHNLGVAPEMIWIKNRSRASNWVVYHKDLNGGTNPETHYLLLQSSAVEGDATFFNDTAPTATQFTVGSFTDVNRINENLIAYLFASLDGISKVGSYTGNGSTQDISLGFSPRLFITKNTDSTYPWYLFDSERGIVAGNDPFLILNTNAAQGTSVDMVDPITNGIRLINSSVNNSGDNYVYYAVA